MRKEDRMELAIHKMASLGLPEKFVRTVTQNALKTYGNWKFLEADDYLVLADLCFGELEAESKPPDKKRLLKQEADSLAIQKGQSMVIYQDSPELRAKVDDNYTPKLRKVKSEPDSRTPNSKGKAPAVESESAPMDEEDTTCRRKLKEILNEEPVTLRRLEKAVVIRDTSGSSRSRLRAFLGPGVRKFARESPFSDDEGEMADGELSLPKSSEPVQSSELALEVLAATQPAVVCNTDALALIASVYSNEEDE